jgi:uncharacterized protein
VRPAAPAGPGGPPWLVVPQELAGPVARIAARARRYVAECTALAVAPGRVAILADHRLLPLSWTRDAYWQALLLLGDRPQRRQRARDDIVAAHLRWLWLDCDRPNASWARSHHANGRRKDERFQADQQLYPLLELCDYARIRGRLPDLGLGDAADRTEWSRLVGGVLTMLDRVADADGLLASDENPADDAADLPYHLSTQILAGYTWSRLGEDLGPLLDLPASTAQLAQRAARLRAATLERFATTHEGRRLWAYAIDDRGRTLVGADANDLPTAFAPLWGFCSPSDPGWRATMDFALSPLNHTYAQGAFGGLGSRHTAGTWSLGLIQEWVARSLAGDAPAAAAALRRLIAVALDDWSLPEASDPHTGRLSARPWFAWPGAVVGALAAGAMAVNSQPLHSPTCDATQPRRE